MTAKTFDDRVCALGEGVFWHPLREQLFWFDILGKKLLTRSGRDQNEWQFDQHVSAAGWVDRDRILVASETELFLFNLITGVSETLTELEANNPITRSNDGRADPYGGFWIGTMGKAAQPKAGKIYRFYKGELRVLFDNITISNAICFSPDGGHAYFADTAEQSIMRVTLDANGWPDDEPAVFVDLSGENLNPDGAVVDANGNLWNAQWGASRVVQYDPSGNELSRVHFPATQVSCPAFGGEKRNVLFATSAKIGAPKGDDLAGQVFSCVTEAQGQTEHQVLL